MRLIVGIVIGAGIVVGAAYFHDTNLDGPLAPTQRLVNWDNVDSKARAIYDDARSQFRQLTGV